SAAKSPRSPLRSGVALVALVAPLATVAVLFLVTSHLIATSVNVEPPRGLDDVRSLSAEVYRALDLAPGNVPGNGRRGGNFLASLQRVLLTAEDNGRSFD